VSRETRRRLLLRAHAAAKRFCKKAEGSPYFVPATDAFVAGWLLGYRARKRDESPKLDDCSRCHGTRGGVPGNENRMPDGSLLCDYCHADDLMRGPPDEGPTGDDAGEPYFQDI